MDVPVPEQNVGVEPSFVERPTIEPITPAASGENIGKAVSGLGQDIASGTQEIAKSYMHHEQMIQDAQVYETVRQVGLYSDNLLDGPDGVKNQTGEAAVGSASRYEEGMQKKLTDVMSTLNPYKKSQFGAAAKFMLLGGQRAAMQMEAANTHKFIMQTNQAAINGYGTSLALNVTTALKYGNISTVSGQRLVGPTKPEQIKDMVAASMVAGQSAAKRQAQVDGQMDSTPYEQKASNRIFKSAFDSVIETNPQDALAMATDPNLMSRLSPDYAREVLHIVHGRMIDVEGHTALTGVDENGKPVANPITFDQETGLPNTDSVNKYFDSLPNYDTEQKDKIINSFNALASAQRRVFLDNNKSLTDKFRDAVSKTDQSGNQAMPIEQANGLAANLAKRNWDGSVNNNSIRENKNFIANIYGPKNTHEILPLANKLWDGLYGIGGTETTNSDIDNAYHHKEISYSTANSMYKMIRSGAAPALKNTLSSLTADLPYQIPDTVKRNEFLSAIHFDLAQKDIRDPGQAATEWNNQLKLVNTGGKHFFGLLDNQDQRASITSAAARNPGLTKAAGGIEEFTQAVQHLGGADLFPADSLRSKVLTGMLKAGWKPGQITTEVFTPIYDKAQKNGYK